MAEVVGKEQATAEVNTWLDAMDIAPENRSKEFVKAAIDVLISAVMSGHLTFGEDGTATQKLKFPLGNGNTSQIEYDFRYEIGEYNKLTKGVSLSDEVDWSIARLVLVSKDKLPKALFEKMKRADFFIASKLTVFF